MRFVGAAAASLLVFAAMAAAEPQPASPDTSAPSSPTSRLASGWEAGEASALPRPLTLTYFKRLGPWKLGVPYRKSEGLTRSRLVPSQTVGDDGGTCTFPPARQDWYGGIKLFWRDWPRAPKLWSVVTTRKGDRSADGFVIGTAKMAAARKRYGTGVTEFRDPGALGRWELYLRGPGRTYSQLWFDARGMLRALTAGYWGC